MAEEIHFDCLILGAGISGLDAAYHIQVILYRIKKVCHQLIQNMKTDFVRFPKICTKCSQIKDTIFGSFEFENNLCTSAKSVIVFWTNC